MKIKYLKLKNWLLVSLGGLLGLPVGCTLPMEYGCPEATYRVKGIVTDEQGNPVAGIGVMKSGYYDDDLHRAIEYYKDTTGVDGMFEVSTIDSPNIDNLKVAFFDIDGEQNGSYRDTVVSVSFVGAQFTGGDGNWYEGQATQTVNVTLQRADE